MNLHLRSLCLLMALLLGGLAPAAWADEFAYYRHGKLTPMPAADWSRLFVTTRTVPTLAEAKRLAHLLPVQMQASAEPMLYAPSGGFVLRLRNTAGLSAATYRQALAALLRDAEVVSALPAFLPVGDGNEPVYVTGKVILHVPAASVARVRQRIRQAGATVAEVLPLGPQTVLVAQAGPGADVFALARRLYAPGLEVAEPNMVVQGHSAAIPNDPLFSQQGFLYQANDRDIDAPEAWDLLARNGGGQVVTVAVVDGHGYDLTHPDLAANYVHPYDAVSNDSIPSPENAFANHGTPCAGIIAAVTDNGVGVASVGGTRLRVAPCSMGFNATSTGTWSTDGVMIARAGLWMIHVPGLVASSHSYYFGAGNFATSIAGSMEAMRSRPRGGRGAVLCAATGNSNVRDAVTFPAGYPFAIGVGASDMDDHRADFSNYGTITDLAAPGVNDHAPDRFGATGYTTADYLPFSGTSAACPVAAGVAGLAGSANPLASADSLEAWLLRSVEKVGGYAYARVAAQPAGTWSAELGYGRVNARQAVARALGLPPLTLVNNGGDAVRALACGQTDTGTTAGLVNDVSFYGVDTAAVAGPDRTYTFLLTGRSVVGLRLAGAPAGMQMYLTRSLDAGTLLAVRAARLDTVLSPGRYYLTLDGRSGVSGAYSLSLDCSCVGAASSCLNNDFIRYVTLDTVTSPMYTQCSGPGSYLSDTAAAFRLYLGRTITLRIANNHPAFLQLYVDLNNDGDFDDAGERLYNSATAMLGHVAPMTVPLYTPIPASGLRTHVRVRSSAFTLPTGPCDSVQVGDTKDFRVTLLPPTLRATLPDGVCPGQEVASALRVFPADIVIPDTAQVRFYRLSPPAFLVQTTFGAARLRFPEAWAGTQAQIQVRGAHFASDTAASSDTVTIDALPAQPVIALEEDSTSLEASVVAARYLWLRNDTAADSTSGRTLHTRRSGSYTVVAYSLHGCAGPESAPFAYTATATRGLLPAPTLRLTPNPASTLLTVSAPGPFSQVEIVDAIGRAVMRQAGGSTSLTLSVAGLPAGVYAVRAGGVFSRFVKE